ncbi:two-component system regulatory protein YycI [Bacillus kwashiorkori]|uniref:two-component system regulatory protein YycI n=1 Tax=Bacillus kwashiorkori TaxID=1522318 RepID=UPI0007806A5B|nr:two-component system regulatory protein YycI [Bacillus kwashiorkori]
MDWSRAKTIFIITFFILDIFLIYQLTNQKNDNTFDLIKETSIEEQLKADEIKVPKLPEKPTKETYIEADAKRFMKDDLFFEGQEISIVNETFVQSLLKKPYKLKDEWEVKNVDSFVTENVFSGSQYRFSYFDQDNLSIIYYQTHKNNPFFQNSSGQLTLHLNENKEIISYTQTMLENIKEIKEQQILTAHEAMVTLYKKRLLKSGSEITRVDIGYYTLVPISTSQLLVPTWRFSIKGQEDLYVNAVEGHAFQLSDQDF